MLKPSHFQTPRSLDQCQFLSAADPIERHVRPFDWQDRIVMWACIFTVVASAWVALS